MNNSKTKKFKLGFSEEDIRDLRRYLALYVLECRTLKKKEHSSHQPTFHLLLRKNQEPKKKLFECNQRQYVYLKKVIQFFTIKELQSPLPNEDDRKKLNRLLKIMSPKHSLAKLDYSILKEYL